MKAIFYSFLICLIVWCQAIDEDRFGWASNITRKVLTNKRNESRYSASLKTKKTSKPCVVTFNDSDISAIFQLAQVTITNIVDIHIKFQSNTRNKQLNKIRFVWTNRLGLQILSLLQRTNAKQDQIAIKSLSVGRKAAYLSISDNPPKCVLKDNPTELLAAELLKRFQSFFF